MQINSTPSSSSPVPIASAALPDKTVSAESLREDPQDVFERSDGSNKPTNYQAVMRLFRQKDFKFPRDQASLRNIASQAGQDLTQKELGDARREVKEMLSVYKEAETLSPSDKAKVQWLNLAENSIGGSLDNIKRTSRDMRWEEMEKQHGKQPSAYKQYFSSSSVTLTDMNAVLKIREELQGDTPRKLENTSAEPLMRENIWNTKMDLLDQAIEKPVRGGKPVEINAEYYEMSSDSMIGKLRDASEAGANVSVVLDPGRLSYVEPGVLDASSLAIRTGTAVKLLDGQEDNNMSVAFYPMGELGGRDRLMHRKIFRVGEDVVLGGMNANKGSNENIDFAVKLNGEGAVGIAREFQEDAAFSAGKSPKQVYGNQLEALRSSESKITMSKWGMENMLRTAAAEGNSGSAAGAEVPQLLDMVREKGMDPSKWARFDDLSGDGKVGAEDVELYFAQSGRGDVELTKQGRKALASMLENTVEHFGGESNREKLADTELPRGKVPKGVSAGETLVVGSSPAERQALVLESIDKAEEFVKISSFVLTEDVANVLIDKKNSMEARGRDFDVQVILDPGLYGYGGTPNEKGFKALEDGGIDVKFSLLERSTNDHDRKNHSKMIVTDNSLLTGSTNFSGKGLRNNWEINSLIRFDENSQESMAKHQAVVEDFDRMWQREAVGTDSRELASQRLKQYKGMDHSVKLDVYRNQHIRNFCMQIENYERQSAAHIAREIPDVVAGAGEEGGYDILNNFGDAEIDAMRKNMSAWKNLQVLSTKAGG